MTTAVTQQHCAKAQKTHKPQVQDNVVIPEYRITHGEEAYEIEVELPGVSENNLNLQLEDRWLILKATPELLAEEGFEPVHSEFGHARFEVGFKVSTAINSAEIKAVLKDGILNLSLPKAKEFQRQNIAVTTG